MKLAMIETCGTIYGAEYFTESDIQIANEHGANIEKQYSKTQKISYWANTCKRCGTFIGEHHLHEYYGMPSEENLSLGYRCYCQVALERQKGRFIIPEDLVCEKCNQDMHKAIMVIGYDSCWNCKKMMKVAMIIDLWDRRICSPIAFTEQEVKVANDNGANIKKHIMGRNNIYVNVCEKCGGKIYTYNNQLPKEIIKEIDWGFKCFNCLTDKNNHKK